MMLIELGLLPSGFVKGDIMLCMLAGLLYSDGPWGDATDSLAPGVVFWEEGGE
jgi:hypothetical protein